MAATEPAMPTAEAAVPGGARRPSTCGGERSADAPAESRDLDSIYEAHFGFIWRTLRRLGVSPGSLDDATQDVFMIAHRRLQTFEGRSSIKTWLCGIALRVARDYRRSARRRGPLVPFEETVAHSTRPTPLEDAQRAEAARLLHRFLDSLDEPKRIAFVLSELEEMTAPEIARLSDTSVNTIYARLRTARRLFVQALRGEHAKERATADE